MILVTGADGSVGQALVPELRFAAEVVLATDIDTLDITNRDQVRKIMVETEPDLIYHLAGAKHAPDGETEPLHVATVNITGTANIVAEAKGRVILASTCKAANPETAYGASKLIAERMVLNSGGTVCRFYNIPESCENVFRLWESLPESEPIPWTPCLRYFNSMADVVQLLLEVRDFPSGRYALDPGGPQEMWRVAQELYPKRSKVMLPRRRGDRIQEPLYSTCEQIEHYKGNVMRIYSDHDV